LPPHVFGAEHTPVQLPQWLLSVPFTLMHPLVPQSIVAPVQMHVPFEQVLLPVQSVLVVH
jgi:hypothetical protein